MVLLLLYAGIITDTFSPVITHTYIDIYRLLFICFLHSLSEVIECILRLIKPFRLHIYT